MITGTYTTEEEVHDAARPAPPPTQPLPSHHHHRRHLTACHRLPLLDDGSWSNLLTLRSKRQCWRDHPCHRVHQPSEKALSVMRRSRGRAAQRPRRCNNFDQYHSVQVGPPATVTPGRLLASPISPLKGRTDWLLSPSTTTRWRAPGGVLLLLNGYIILKE